MISTHYINAYKRFIEEEIPLIGSYEGAEKGLNYSSIYYEMVEYLEDHPEEFINFTKSGISKFEFDLIENVDTLFELFSSIAEQKNIPNCVWFLPRVRLEGVKYIKFIHKEVAKIIRDVFDNCELEDFKIYRAYEAHHRRGELILWAKWIKGKEALKTTSKITGIPQNKLIVGKLKLFDDSFVSAQYQYMSEWSWVHKEFVEVYKAQKKSKK